MTKKTPVYARKPSTARNRPYHRWLIEAALVIAVLAAVHAVQTRNLAEGSAPEFEARLLDGRQIQLREFRGRPLLLQFWATWCPVCRWEIHTLDALARDYAVVTIALEDSSPDRIRAWLLERGVSFPVARDADGRLAAMYGVEGVPTSIVIDPDGIIRFVEVGYTTELGLRMRLWWAGRDYAD